MIVLGGANLVRVIGKGSARMMLFGRLFKADRMNMKTFAKAGNLMSLEKAMKV